MSDRELVADLLTRLPEDASLDAIARAIGLIAGLRKAREQARRGEGVSIEELRKLIPAWCRQ
jgi:hypothetical protein